jgi:hypothetical protein
MKELEIWLQKTYLIINTEKKTVAMFFHSNQCRLQNKPRVVFNKPEIAFKPKVRFLGIYITENLKWNVHVHLLSYKI